MLTRTLLQMTDRMTMFVARQKRTKKRRTNKTTGDLTPLLFFFSASFLEFLNSRFYLQTRSIQQRKKSDSSFPSLTWKSGRRTKRTNKSCECATLSLTRMESNPPTLNQQQHKNCTSSPSNVNKLRENMDSVFFFVRFVCFSYHFTLWFCFFECAHRDSATAQRDGCTPTDLRVRRASR